MAVETTFENPQMDTNWSGGKAYSWLCSGHYYSAADWTAEVTFKPKSKPLRVRDRVKFNNTKLFTDIRGTIVAIHSDWAWVTWGDASSDGYPETVALINLTRADD